MGPAEDMPAASARIGRLAAHAVFGGWDARAELAGVAGLLVPTAPKLRHKGRVWGMYVRPEARRQGLAAALLRRLLAHAQDVVEEVGLTVVASNGAAVRLYEALGFVACALDPRAMKVAGRLLDEVLMTLPLGGPAAGR